jgi:nucleoid-associated protein YgaU
MKRILCTITLVALSASVAAAQDTDDANMLALTQSVLSGINGGSAEPEPQEKKGDLSSLIMQAMEEGQSDAYLEALLGEAVDQGTIDVPEAMVSTDGAVDTKTLLASLVSKSLDGATSESDLAKEATGAAEQSAEPRRHTVESGESLAGIALRYYGSAAQYETIFAANRDSISRPNLIRVGQIIVIP